MLKRMISGVMLAVMSMAIIVVCPTTGFTETHKRDDWYIGFGLGGGTGAGYTVNGKEITFNDWFMGASETSKASLNFKVGATLNSKTLLGFDGTLFGQEGNFGNEKGHLQINNYFLMLTHFPFEEGLFLRGGGGLSNIMYSITGGANDSSDVTGGGGLLVGIGYAFWLGEHFNLTLNVDHSRQFYPSSDEKPESSKFTIFYLGFDWY